MLETLMDGLKAQPDGSFGDVMNCLEVAKFLRITSGNPTKSISRYASLGKLKGQKIGGEWRFYKPDVIAFLRGR